MLSYSRSHLSDQVLLRTLAVAVTQDRASTAEMLALISEVDRRGLFRAEGYTSMYKYCVGKLRMSEDVACKRILTARAARQLPVIIPAIADGHLNVSTVALMSRYLKTSQGEELLTAALGKTRAEVELLIAERFPKPDVPTSLRPVAPLAAPPAALPAATPAVTPAHEDAVILPAPPAPPAQVVANTEALSAPGRINPETSEPLQVESLVPQRRVAPLSPGRFELRLTISQALHDKLQHAQELLGHAVPTGDFGQIIDRALDELIAKQEKLKFAATKRPRPARRSSNPRHLPAHVKRAVWNRDKGRCTFVSDDGHRCEARKLLEYDHEQPVARGGATSIANVRLRCRAHNQLEAERVFGSGFMEEKRARNGSRQGRYC